MTADTCHVVATGSESRQLLYVAMSRGRHANHVYLGAACDGDPHSVLDPETFSPSTAIEVLARVLGRDESQRSATTTQRELAAPGRRLHEAALRYQDALGFAAAKTVDAEWRASLDRWAEAVVPGLTTCRAYPTLASRLALRELTGSDARRYLARAADLGELDTAHDAAAVLDHRLGSSAPGGPLPWLPGVPHVLAAPQWGDYLGQRAQLVTDLAAEVRASVESASPAWAAGLDPTLRGDLAVWRAAYDVPASDTRPSGPPTLGTGAAYQRTLDQRVGRAVVAGHVWTDVLPAEVNRDPRRGALFKQLDKLAASRTDARAILEEALAGDPLPTEVPADALWWRTAGLASTRPAPPTSARFPVFPTPGPSTDSRHEYELSTFIQRQDRGYGPPR